MSNRLSKNGIRRLAATAAIAWSCLVAGAASATPISLATPGGLNPGDQFRFVFVTLGTIDATSNDIGVYNDFVNVQAAGATYDGSTVSWKAIGSTRDGVDARTNVGGFGDSVPVYRVDGTRVAENLTAGVGSGFWGTAWDASISRSIDGTEINDFVWTGSNNDGTAKFDNELGGMDGTQVGDSSSTYSAIQSGFSPMNSSFGQRMFVMSETLVAVPEPSTCALALAGLACGSYLARRSRRRQRA